MIDHEASASASGSADRQGPGPRRRRSSRRPLAIGCLLALAVFGAVFWRSFAILGCWSLARFSSDWTVVVWHTTELSHFGPSALPALARLADRPGLQQWVAAERSIALLRARYPEANAPIHDLLLSSSVRVRAAAAVALVESDEKEEAAVPVLVEALEEEDPDVRYFVASALLAVQSRRLEKCVKEKERAFKRALEALADGISDPREVFLNDDNNGTRIHGAHVRVGPSAAWAVARNLANPDEPFAGDFASPDLAKRVLEGHKPAELWDRARSLGSQFFADQDGR